MRRGIRWVVVLAVLWCAWWALASYGAQRGLNAMIEARKADGWQADVSQGGFPLRIQSTLSGLNLPNPAQQVALKAEEITVSAPTYWPGYVTLDLPETPITLQTPVSDVVLETTGGEAGVRLHPGSTLQLQSLRALSESWRIHIAGQDVVLGDNLQVRAIQDADEANKYDVTIAAQQLTPGPLLRALLKLPADWPTNFDSFDADTAITFDKPIDRHAADGTPPQPRQVLIRSVDILWGPVQITASGALNIDPAGVPEGKVTAQVTNWERLLDIAVNTGAIKAEDLLGPKLILGAVASSSGSPDNIDLELIFENGALRANDFPLGGAPNLRFE